MTLDDLAELNLLPAALREERHGHATKPESAANGCCIQGSVVGSVQPDDPFHHSQNILGTMIDLLEQAMFRWTVAWSQALGPRSKILNRDAVVEQNCSGGHYVFPCYPGNKFAPPKFCPGRYELAVMTNDDDLKKRLLLHNFKEQVSMREFREALRSRYKLPIASDRLFEDLLRKLDKAARKSD